MLLTLCCVPVCSNDIGYNVVERDNLARLLGATCNDWHEVQKGEKYE